MNWAKVIVDFIFALLRAINRKFLLYLRRILHLYKTARTLRVSQRLARFKLQQLELRFPDNIMNIRIIPALLAVGLLAPFTFSSSAQAQNVDVITVAPVRPAAADMTVEQIKALGQGVAFPYEILNRVLSKVVDSKGQVNYGQAHKSDDLALYVRAVGLAEMDNFPVFQEKDETGKVVPDERQPLAFYINAYNALFLQAVSDAYPVGGVGEIADLGSKKRLVAGQEISLDELRKKITDMDARANFVLMDGTKMGPRAVSGALLGFSLDGELNAAIRSFINDPIRVAPPSRLSNEVTVSPWLQSVDGYFQPNKRVRRGDGIKQLLMGYTTDKANQRYFGAGAYTIEYSPAQSGLNQPSNSFDSIGEGDLGGG